MQNMVTEENTQEKRGRGRPRKMVNNLENVFYIHMILRLRIHYHE